MPSTVTLGIRCTSLAVTSWPGLSRPSVAAPSLWVPAYARMTMELRRHSFRRHPHCRTARLVRRDALFHHGAEMADQSLDRPSRGVTQCADRVALDLASDLLQ